MPRPRCPRRAAHNARPAVWLNVWQAGTQVLSVLWAEDGAFKELNRIGFRLYEGFRVCGYSAGRPLAEVWEVNMTRMPVRRRAASWTKAASACCGTGNMKR